MLDRSSTSTWSTGEHDLWGAGEHLVLHERGWDADAEAVVDRFHVVDLSSAEVEVFGVSERRTRPSGSRRCSPARDSRRRPFTPPGTASHPMRSAIRSSRRRGSTPDRSPSGSKALER